LRDWPGVAGPLVHVPDPVVASEVVEVIAAAMAPRYRVLSVSPRESVPYQVAAADLLGMLDQFGFSAPVLIGEGLGCLAALIVSAWYPTRVGGLVLVDTAWEPPPGDSVAARALRDCPPNLAALHGAVRCPVVEVPPASTSLAQDIEAFLAALP
jgi:pimeloyl-ACP methyl ester carboxylesterase